MRDNWARVSSGGRWFVGWKSLHWASYDSASGGDEPQATCSDDKGIGDTAISRPERFSSHGANVRALRATHLYIVWSTVGRARGPGGGSSERLSALRALRNQREDLAETEGFEPSIGLYKPITV